MSTPEEKANADQVLEKLGNDLVAHTDKLHSLVHNLTMKCWALFDEGIAELDPDLPIPDANYVITGVCANLMAHHFAHLIVIGGAEKAHTKKEIAENFTTWYHTALDHFEKQMKEALGDIRPPEKTT